MSNDLDIDAATGSEGKKCSKGSSWMLGFHTPNTLRIVLGTRWCGMDDLFRDFTLFWSKSANSRKKGKGQKKRLDSTKSS